LALAAAGVALVLASRSLAPVVVGASMAGLGLASVFPITVSLLSHWFGEMAALVGGAVFPLGNLGGAALPWLVGVISTGSGSLRVGFLVPLFGALSMLAVYLAAGRHRPGDFPAEAPG
jgi:fucose permease